MTFSETIHKRSKDFINENACSKPNKKTDISSKTLKK